MDRPTAIDLSIRVTSTLSDEEREELLGMLREAFGPGRDGAPHRYDETSWQHCQGGTHFLLRHEGRLASHAALVPRTVEQGGLQWRCAYGESMATLPDLRHLGLGTCLLALASQEVKNAYDIGAFGASKYGYYGRMGWERWPGRTFHLKDGKRAESCANGGDVMYLLPDHSAIDPNGELTIDWREGDIW
ncbi:GNAT family N-acetyltransferase [Streptomyces sp. NPDC050418]|uniref:GNAT family N-acetyltransferase n=1 Tax=Streptomyces sp. NPDC050418 TaxID=3365612 RepID=UPI0037930B91